MSSSADTPSHTESGEFDGQDAKLKYSDKDRHVDIYYGGKDKPDGEGHNHVSVVNDQVRYWREDDKDLINDRTGETNI